MNRLLSCGCDSALIMRVVSFSEFLGLLISLKEETSLLLTVLTKKSGIEVCRLDGGRIISPLVNVGVCEGSLNSNVMLLLPGLELLRHGRISGSLKLLNLVSVKAVIIEDLPLLGGTLISLDATFSNSLGADDILNPVLHLNEHFLHARVVVETSDSTVVPDHVLLVVSVVKVHLAGGELDSQSIHLLLLIFEGGPKLISHILRVNSRHGLSGAINVVIISTPSREIIMSSRLPTDPGL